LMAIVDVYDALTNVRTYKKAFSHEKSVKIIREEMGAHLDPAITEIFLTHEKEFKKGIVKAKHAKPIQLQPTLKTVANAIGTRGGKKHGHVQRMLRPLEIFINALLQHEEYKKEISSWDIDFFLMSAKLYDIGKIAVPCHILNKTGTLNAEDHHEVKVHADFGAKIIRQIKKNVEHGSLLHHAEALAGSHHENWNGTGYPHGLKGKGIPLEGRIMAIVDVYEMLTSGYLHKEKKTHEEVVEIIKNGSGTQFDPGLVDVFLDCEKDWLSAPLG